VRADLWFGPTEHAASDSQATALRLRDGQGDVVDRPESHPPDDEQRQANARRQIGRRLAVGVGDEQSPSALDEEEAPATGKGVGAVGERDEVNPPPDGRRGQGGRGG
jgi:hypothetical protein